MLENFDPITYQDLLTLIEFKVYRNKTGVFLTRELASVFRKIAKYINQIETDAFSVADIENSLNFTDPGKVLDARQGKILKDFIDNIEDDVLDEIINREDADDVLQDNIDDEQTARIAADDDLQDQIDDLPTSAEVTTAINNYDTTIKGGVPSDGNTLNKLNNKIIQGFTQVIFANIAARDAYNVTHLPFQAFVTDDGDTRWAVYQALSTGTGATFIKISDPDLLNAAMSNAQIKTAYESNVNTNAFTDTQLAKLAGIAGGATANQSDATLKARANHTGTQTVATISDFNSAVAALIAGKADDVDVVHQEGDELEIAGNKGFSDNISVGRRITSGSVIGEKTLSKISSIAAIISGGYIITDGVVVADKIYFIVPIKNELYSYTPATGVTALIADFANGTDATAPHALTKIIYYGSKFYLGGVGQSSASGDESSIYSCNIDGSSFTLSRAGIGISIDQFIIYGVNLYALEKVLNGSPSDFGSNLLKFNGTSWSVVDSILGTTTFFEWMIVYNSLLYYRKYNAGTVTIYTYDGTSIVSVNSGSGGTSGANKVTLHNSKIVFSTSTPKIYTFDGTTLTDTGATIPVMTLISDGEAIYITSNLSNSVNSSLYKSYDLVKIASMGIFLSTSSVLGSIVFSINKLYFFTGSIFEKKEDAIRLLREPVVRASNPPSASYLLGLNAIGDPELWQGLFLQPPLLTVATSLYDLDFTTNWVEFTGSTVIQHRLPNPVICPGYFYLIRNNGTTYTRITNTNSVILSNIAENNYELPVGETVMLISDGTYWILNKLPVSRGVLVSASGLTAVFAVDYYYTGTSDGTITLPAVTGYTASRSQNTSIRTKNIGTAVLTIAVTGGGNDLYVHANKVVSTIKLYPGDFAEFYPNTSNWIVYITKLSQTPLVEITAATVTLEPNVEYKMNRGTLITATLPLNANSFIGDKIPIRGYGAGGWLIAQPEASTVIHGTTDSTTGVTGSIASTARYNDLTLEKIAANEWKVINSQGTLVII